MSESLLSYSSLSVGKKPGYHAVEGCQSMRWGWFEVECIVWPDMVGLR